MAGVADRLKQILYLPLPLASFKVRKEIMRRYAKNENCFGLEVPNSLQAGFGRYIIINQEMQFEFYAGEKFQGVIPKNYCI